MFEIARADSRLRRGIFICSLPGAIAVPFSFYSLQPFTIHWRLSSDSIHRGSQRCTRIVLEDLVFICNQSDLLCPRPDNLPSSNAIEVNVLTSSLDLFRA